ncbi:MAG: ATP-binding protein [Pseudotabrizicola sp.]|uniref:sensor histidine kinase n=1 Tax=Pseudotabrizicola sp. TaxID=2939647 RepID=UPI0027222539|nr:ATP-binding protein [Pseudotabrizicola sp.]MDO8882697.1 ATP-binding protein [Pseudotabrizicola sp.]MDP2079722.1 ATP-binding protein [Pseudotabrizicola sp.]MDZ7575691.1 ATP-binding protein [Pseudotabrizicola sp.]
MRAPRSLQGRLALWLGLLLTLLWIGAASVTAIIVRQSLEETFDSSLQETVQRILPLAVLDIIEREEEGVTQQLAAIGQHAEFLTYIIRDAQGRILLQSHAADPRDFPDWDGAGFRTSATHRFYNEAVLQGTIRMTVAEPLANRARVARDIQMSLGLPLLIVIPLALLAILLVVSASLAPLHRLRTQLAARGARDMSQIAVEDLPAEVAPVADTLNTLLHRLSAAFDAERSFAANAAHELRTPLAGAIAQAQRLQSETSDPAASARAADIEATLKRLTRLSERLMQLARAEGGRLRLETASDLRPVLRLVIGDMARGGDGARLILSMADTPVLSDLDPDAFAILARNLADNALRHGMQGAPVHVSLSATGVLQVDNEGPVVPPQSLNDLTARFVRSGPQMGSGLGLAIVAAIADRTGAELQIDSPRSDRIDGVSVRFHLPMATA